MAKYGAKNVIWAPIATEPTSGLPTYGTAVDMQKLSKLTDSPVIAEAKQYGDNVLCEHVSEFTEVGIDLETTELSNAMVVAVFGATAGTGENPDITFSEDDTAPYGGLGIIVCKIVNNVKKYVGVFYPKIKAQIQGEEYNTKADSITLTGEKLHFVGTTAKNGDWKVTSGELATEAAAKTWLNGKFGITV